MTDIQKTLEFIVVNYSTFDNFIIELNKIHEINKKIVYEEEKYNKDAWNNVVQTAKILEDLDILLGKVKLEDLRAASRTLAPKMQSSFGE